MRPEVQRYLIWALDFTPTQKHLGWSETEWSLLSRKDMALFYRYLFFYRGVFALAYIILLKQLSPENLEAKMMNGGLSKISPMALMNFLRILLLRLKDFRWKNGKIAQNIPEINADEWPQILSHCTKQEFQFLIKLNGDPKAAMPNQATG